MITEGSDWLRQESIQTTKYGNGLLDQLNSESQYDDTIRKIADNLIITDPDLIQILQSDPKAATAVIRLLSKLEQKEAVFSLISNLKISTSNEELLEAVIKVGLNADASIKHRWIVDYDIVGQRLEMIRTVVLPYVKDKCPQKNLFCALKEYEAESLDRGKPLISPELIYDVIANARNSPSTRPEVFQKSLVDKSEQRDFLRLVMPNQIFNILLRLAWVSQDYVYDLLDRHTAEDLIALLRTLDKVIPVYLIPTHLGYPMGGGESFMHQTCRILSEFSVKCIWVSFLDPKLGWYSIDSTTYTPYYIDVRYSGGRCREGIQRAVDQFNPDLIHAQGGTNDEAMEIAEKSRITTMIGYHFWSGLIELGKSSNKHIIENIARHKLRIPPYQQSKLIWKYVASEFMQEVYSRLGGQEKLHVIHPISDNAQFFIRRDNIGTYVLQVNICPLKGGGIFLDCVKTLGHEVPFMGIQSEQDRSDFFSHLAEEMALHPLCVLSSYGNVRDFYRTARMVIVPTLVDETFCRVAFEAAMNGIPVLSTANGYLPLMLGDTGIFLPEESADWIGTIRELYNDIAQLKKIGESQRARLQKIFGNDFKAFISASMQLIDNSASKNIGIFTVWADLGLGNLSHTYAKILRSVGYRVHIFSFQPYSSIGNALLKQRDPQDWDVPTNADSVYYSFNHREAVTVNELSQFILANNIKTLIVPEICWQTNWERLFALKISKLMICGVPMIEIVIREEIQNHNLLASTFHCTKLSESILSEAGIHNGVFLGHGFGRPLPHDRVENKRHNLASRPKIRFLHVAGHNPTSRKNTPQVIDSFVKAFILRDDIELTVTSMLPLGTYYKKILPAGITILAGNLSRNDILELYEAHDVSIQVSSHEGLGLGFYESISRCTPVVSINAPPHNEIVLDGETGWLIPAKPILMPDNEKSPVSAWVFDTSDLTRCILSLDRSAIDRVIRSTHQIYRDRFDEVALLTRFLKVLPRRPLPARVSTRSLEIGTSSPIEGWSEALADERTLMQQGMLTADRKYNMSVLFKRGVLTIARSIYQLVRPVTRRIAYRLRLLIIDATSDIRQEIKTLMQTQATQSRESWQIVNSLRQEIKDLAYARSSQDQSMLDALTGLGREVRFVKERMASYAGCDSVLTYLRDESPIFVNTGDLGCPSPIVNGGVWEPENTDVLLSFVTCDTVFIDVGANVGYFSIAIGNRLGKKGRVFAFEPHPKLVNLLERSIHLNSLEGIVTVRQCAVSDRNHEFNLFYPNSHLGKGSITRNSSEKGITLHVQARTLDDLLPGDLVVDLVKIDVEGHELAVLRGMGEIFRRSPRIKVLFEKLESSNINTELTWELLCGFNLNLYGIGPNAVLHPLDKKIYSNWIGDVIAAPIEVIDCLTRTGFSIYPGQLTGEGKKRCDLTCYTRNQTGVLFFGPDWYLRQGNWRVQLHGHLRGSVRLVIVEENEVVVAEISWSESVLHGCFTVHRNICHFEMRAYAMNEEALIELDRIEFQRI